MAHQTICYSSLLIGIDLEYNIQVLSIQFSLLTTYKWLHINLYNVDIPWPELWVIFSCIPWIVSFVLFWSFGLQQKRKRQCQCSELYCVCFWIYLWQLPKVHLIRRDVSNNLHNHLLRVCAWPFCLRSINNIIYNVNITGNVIAH